MAQSPGTFGDTRPIEFIGTLSLGDMQQQIRDLEAIIGPFVAFGTAGANNRLSFNVAPPPPRDSLILMSYNSASPPAKEGHVLTCSGLAWIRSEASKVAAYRPL